MQKKLGKSRLFAPGVAALATFGALALAAGFGAGRGGNEESPPAPEGPEAPEREGLLGERDAELGLVLLIVIDQLPSWSFEANRDYLEGGIARLLDEGVYFREAEFPFSATYTAPGHAALATGSPPAQSGILANEWYRRGEGASRTATADPDAPVHAVGERAPSAQGVSGRQLDVPGVADALREARGGAATSLAIGIKPRAVALMAGARPDLAAWYDPSQRAMTTSAYYADEVPDWLADENARHPPAGRFADVWSPTDPDRLGTITGRPDDAPGEGQFPGYFDRVFPHAISATLAPSRAIRLTPSAAEMALDVARAAVAGEGLGAEGETDFLAIALGSHDYAGHYWGQESWERTDLLLRIDRMLGSFFEELDELLGADNYATLLTGDHGAAPLIEESPDDSARRIPPREVEEAALDGVSSILGEGDWLEARSASTLFFQGFDEKDEAERDRALDAAVRSLREVEGIGYADRTRDIAGACGAREGIEARACRSLRPELGEIFFAPAEYSMVTGFPTGTTHGSPHDYDRLVPLLIRAPGWEAGAREERASILRVAATLADLLGIPAPEYAPDALEPP